MPVSQFWRPLSLNLNYSMLPNASTSNSKLILHITMQLNIACVDETTLPCDKVSMILSHCPTGPNTCAQWIRRYHVTSANFLPPINLTARSWYDLNLGSISFSVFTDWISNEGVLENGFLTCGNVALPTSSCL